MNNCLYIKIKNVGRLRLIQSSNVAYTTKIAHCGFGWKIGILSYKVFYVYGFTHKKSKRWIETDTNETVRLYRKEKKEDYLKCESDIRKSIKTFPFTLLYPLFVATKAKAVCLIAIKKEFIFPFVEIAKISRVFWTKLHFMVKRF